jgi:RNA polymerase sigma-70 factor (ECF subfamily)
MYKLHAVHGSFVRTSCRGWFAYGRYAEPLYAFIYHHLGGPRVDAEDLWQDVLLAALQSMPTYRGASQLFTWLCSIARHKIIDHLRRQGRRDVDVFTDLGEGQLSTLACRTHLPEEVVMQRSTRIRVIKALVYLPENYRRALVARYADDRSVAQVAHMLGRSYKATESLLSRARAAFRQALSTLEESE